MEINSIVGQNIKYYRYEKNMTQEELSEKIKISTNSISCIENGKSDIRLSRLYIIAEALEVNVEQLFKNNANTDLKWRVDLKGKN